MKSVAAGLQCILFVALALPWAAALAQHSPAVWQMEPSETTADLRGVHAAGPGVVWASGTGGTVLRSEDSGFEWQNCATPPGAEKLDFRAIWGFDDQTAIVMSSGPGALSRLYKTTDGCAHWALLYTNPDKDGFWDALVFENRDRGTLLGDPVNGRFQVLHTTDGGRSWTQAGGDGLEAKPGVTGAFAASNSSLLAGPREQPRFGAGGSLLYAETILIHLTAGAPHPDSVRPQWKVTALPLAHDNTTSGIFSLALRDSQYNGATLIAVGGDYARPDARSGTAAWSSDDGAHWTVPSTLPGGYRSAVAWDADLKLWITVGPNGSDISRDDGRTWQTLEHAPANTPGGGEWNALSLPWVVGPHGRIAKLNPSALNAPAATSR